ncbi:MAG: IS66 family transposase [Acidimicrobiales bacterium]
MQGDSKRFHDRQDAGTEFAGLLEHLRNEHELLVTGLPRGGVPVADSVARALRAPDVFVVHPAYGCLDSLRFIHAWCLPHVRRGIMRAAASKKGLEALLQDIAAMYALWHARRDGTDDGTTLLSALASMRDRLDIELTEPETLAPRAKKVLKMIDSHWDGLITFASHPEIVLDNNAAERALRPEVLLRKNCRGSGSPFTADLAGSAFSAIATAAQWNLNPLSYLHAYLRGCAQAGGDAPDDITAFLCWSASPEDLASWRAPPQ